MAGTFRKASVLSQLHGMQQQTDRMLGTWCLGLMFFDTDIEFEMIRELVEEKLLEIPRFRSRYSFEDKGFIELSEEDLDLTYHIQHVDRNLPLDELLDFYVGNVYGSFEVDYDKPLWRITYFSKLEDGRSVLLYNSHHLIGDGVSHVEVLYRLMDKETVSTSLQLEDVQTSRKAKKRIGTFGLINRVAIRTGGVLSVFNALFATPDSPSVLMRKDITEASLQKNIAFTDHISLERIKKIKEKYEGATVNDVLVALLTMTLRAYLEEKGSTDVFKQIVRASFPINARQAGEDPFRDGSPHNELALGVLKFPFDYTRRTDVIHKVRRATDAIKLSPGPFVQKAVGSLLLRVLPEDLTSKLFVSMGNQATAMLSNVKGPSQAAYINGNKIVDLQFGLYSSNGLYLGLISYDGKVSCGITMDSTLGDPKQ